MSDRIVAFLQMKQTSHTRAELADALDIPTATMSGRINALVMNGRVLAEPGRFTCRITGNSVGAVSAAN
jgi:predicted ArsR family transcriptional regulator